MAARVKCRKGFLLLRSGLIIDFATLLKLIELLSTALHCCPHTYSLANEFRNIGDYVHIATSARVVCSHVDM